MNVHADWLMRYIENQMNASERVSVQAEKGRAKQLRDALRKRARQRGKPWSFSLDACSDIVHVSKGLR